MTFKTRYRVKQRCFRKPLVILQVQVTVESNYDQYETTTSSYLAWRDATPEDLINAM